jgi:serine/threonine protein kinase
MAPEMFKGEAGNEATDIYALGVTMFRAFTGEFPYGNPDVTSPPGATGRRTSPPCAPICPRGWERSSGGRSPPILMNAFATRRNSPPRWRPGRLWRPRRRRPQTLLELTPARFWQGAAALFGVGASRVALAEAVMWKTQR